MLGHRWVACAISVASWVLAGCGGGEDAADPYEPFPPYEETTVFTYSGQAPLMDTGSMISRVVGTVSVGGKTIPRQEVVLNARTLEDLKQPGKPSFQLWIGEQGGAMLVGGLSLPQSTGLPFEAVVDPPVSVALDPPVGVPQDYTFNATIKTPGQATGQPVTLTAHATLEERGVAVQAPMGTIPGCNRYTGSGTVSGSGVPPMAPSGPFNAEVWYHPTFGVVKANIPELGISVGIAAEEDYAGTGPGMTAIRKVGVVDETNTQFVLSTYDRAGQTDADKLTHAKMLLELRWASDSEAATMAPPGDADLDISFDGGFGYFPHFLGETTASYFFPDEKGFRYNYGFVDQALRNEGGTRGSIYSVYVSRKQGASAAPVRVSARIVYRSLTPAEQAEPMPPFE